MDIKDKLEDWKRQLEQAEEYGMYFDRNTVKEMIETIKNQQNQIDVLSVNKKGAMGLLDESIITAESLGKKYTECKKALEFYANENSYVTNIGNGVEIEATVMIDNGDRAKKVLSNFV
ncbi:hypothetical protein HF072_00455 [Bacillus sp. RO3]|nr:hypothetical protein [Bacillus sp. RO3]